MESEYLRTIVENEKKMSEVLEKEIQIAKQSIMKGNYHSAALSNNLIRLFKKRLRRMRNRRLKVIK